MGGSRPEAIAGYRDRERLSIVYVEVNKMVDCLPLASESAGELDVLGLDGDSLGVDGL